MQERRTNETSLSSNRSTSDFLGQLVAGRYSLLCLLGKGGMGKVFEAYDTVMNRSVAVKVMDSSDLAEHRVVRFHRGVKAASSITHPNVARTLDFGLTAENRPYMVMELVRGVTLRALIKSARAIPVDLSIEIAAQVCDGMAAAHKQGIIHRDLTPSNIILENLGTIEPRAKILDFGIALITSQSRQEQPVTRPGEVVGSPVYMSPEQVQGRELDHRSDIYAIGCILFEMLSGRPAFRGNSPLETMSLHVLEPAPSLCQFDREDIVNCHELDRILQKCMDKDVSRRYQKVESLRADLFKYLVACENSEHDLHSVPICSVSSSAFAPTQVDSISARTMRVIGSVNWYLRSLFATGIVLLLAGLSLLAYLVCQLPGQAQSDRDYTDIAISEIPAAKELLSPAHEKSVLQFLGIADTNQDRNEIETIDWRGGVVKGRVLKSKSKTGRFLNIIAENRSLTVEDMNTIVASSPVAVDLSGCELSDRHLYVLSRSRSIERLKLGRNKAISGAGLAMLERMSRLSFLSLESCDLTDADISFLSLIPALESLDLRNNPEVSVNGLQHLVGRNSPINLWLDGCACQSLSAREIKKLAMEHIYIASPRGIRQKG